MKLREKIISIFTRQKQPVRTIEQETGIPKSTAHHHKQKIEMRNQFDESTFWETEAGYNFLKRIVIATIYTFGIKGGSGAGRIREFFEYIRIGTHVGISDSSILLIIKDIECLILEYRDTQKAQIKKKVKDLKLILGVDETWFDQMYLVCTELSSGYIIMEESAKDRSAATWDTQLKKTERIIFELPSALFCE